MSDEEKLKHIILLLKLTEINQTLKENEENRILNRKLKLKIEKIKTRMSNEIVYH